MNYPEFLKVWYGFGPQPPPPAPKPLFASQDSPDWSSAPPQARYACISVTGRWWYYASRPKWDFVYGQWDADVWNTPADDEYVEFFGRAARKRSLHQRPETFR